MERSTYEKFRKLVYDQSGICLGANKEALVSARIGKRMRALGLSDHGQYLRFVVEDNTGEELIKLIDAISTNVTSFFRESVHFDFLQEVFSGWLEEGQHRFRFWSAASSTGEEPYSMAMTLREAMNGHKADVRILATDISTRALEQCHRATYRADKLNTVPKPLLHKYFNRTQDGDFRVAQSLKDMLLFRRMNLMTPPFPMRGPLDVVFCRNVMIYFDNPVRRKLLTEIYRLLKPGGYLMVGHTETLVGIDSTFTSVRPAIYVK